MFQFYVFFTYPLFFFSFITIIRRLIWIYFSSTRIVTTGVHFYFIHRFHVFEDIEIKFGKYKKVRFFFQLLEIFCFDNSWIFTILITQIC